MVFLCEIFEGSVRVLLGDREAKTKLHLTFGDDDSPFGDSVLEFLAQHRDDSETPEALEETKRDSPWQIQT